ncbi:hypothetical protein [Parasitella parasitica]|uniref:OTU domain-containing protein n=1 Tax=Parasitella parasitica TaxID=35722 RepID=A0A0B7NEF6_9FUNG|nr:hypothetical protein [Parasitella parasitica]
MAFQRFALARIDILSTDPKSKLAPCTGVFTKTLGISCAHLMKLKLLDHESPSLTKEEFHRQWWITKTSLESESDDKEHKGDPFSEESIQRKKEMYTSIPPFEQVIVKNLLESIKTGQLPYSLRDPAVVQSKGRPKGAGNRKQDTSLSTTQRNSSQFEYAEMQTKKENSSLKRKTTANQESERHTKSKQDIDGSEDDKKSFFGAFYNESEYGPLLPKDYYEISSKIEDSYYDAIINIDRDGFCGFRALAHQLFDNQDEFVRVKLAMRDNLIDVKDTHKDAFPFFDVDQLERIVTHGISNQKGDKNVFLEKPFGCGVDYWFLAPECAQLAACTFNRPVFVYYTGESITYLPILPPQKLKPVVAPLLIHIVQTNGGSKPNHWVT